ncbi:unnamed protein product [Cunninghamella blakesleeana]
MDDNNDTLVKETKEIVSSISDISFQLPARKKYTLAITSCSTLQLINEKTKQIEYEYAIHPCQTCICVPTPEKPQGSFTFSIFSQPNENHHDHPSSLSSLSSDTIVFNLLDKGTITIQSFSSSSSSNHEQTYTTPEEKKQAMIDFILKHVLKEDQQKMILPSKEYYTCSGVSASTGKPELDRTFVNTYLRNKEGVLYFLPTGILYGFKKPTLFIPLSMISATIITNITKRTFDLHFQFFPTKLPLGNNSDPSFWTPFLQHDENNDNEKNDKNDKNDKKKTVLSLPFSMIEQTEFAGIDGYIKKMGITDQSMTEATKAPEPTSNKKGKGVDRGDHDEKGNDQESNLFLGDEDDSEEDVDFEPGNHSDDDALEYDSNASDDEGMDDEVDEGDEDELEDDS